MPTHSQPLAARMRPRTLDELVGQDHLLYPGSPLHRLVDGSLGAPSVILWAPPSTGKALANGTPVLTPNGWTPIEELKVGDSVIGSTGQNVRVTGVFPQGLRPLYQISFSDGASVVCDEDHLWTHYQSRKHKDREHDQRTYSRTMTTLQLKNGELLNRRKWKFPVVSPVQHTKSSLPLDPYLLGSLLADGSFTSQTVQWTKSSEREPAIVAKIVTIAAEMGLSVNTRINSVPQGWASEQHTLVLPRKGMKNNPLKKALADLNLDGKKSAEKFIPEQYLVASEEDRRSLLAGLFDGDGSVLRTSGFPAKYSSASERLARDVLSLLWSFGLQASMSFDKFDHTYEVSLHSAGFNPFRHSVSASVLKSSTKWTKHRQISSIDKVDDGLATCISVDSADKLYVTKDYILTHNTSIARIVAATTAKSFVELSATSAGVKDVRKAVADAEVALAQDPPIGTVLFIDEVHRFSKSQQDILLPAVESGTVSLIGATTENPSFSVNPALRSRAILLKLEPLSAESIITVIDRALADPGGLPDHIIAPDAAQAIARLVSGDARQALTLLELAAGVAEADLRPQIVVSDIERVAPTALLRYDHDGDQHYDITSAFIKSMRASDPDAAIHWLARLLASGEDPRFIARRVVIAASEDVGMADPAALQVATAAHYAVSAVGMPEARIMLAQAVVHVATARKSNRSYVAINEALADVTAGRTGTVPMHLRDAHYPGAQALGHGQGYVYDHDCPHGVGPQQPNGPEGMALPNYYRPSDHGYEAGMAQNMAIVAQLHQRLREQSDPR